jgi:hypothetical protein
VHRPTDEMADADPNSNHQMGGRLPCSMQRDLAIQIALDGPSDRHPQQAGGREGVRQSRTRPRSHQWGGVCRVKICILHLSALRLSSLPRSLPTHGAEWSSERLRRKAQAQTETHGLQELFRNVVVRF